MNKLDLVIALQNDVYLKKICGYILEKSPHFNVTSFTSAQRLREYMAAEIRTDILLMDELLLDEVSAAHYAQEKNIEALAVLCVNGDANYPRWKRVRKFGRTDALINELLLLYSEVTGNPVTARNGYQRKVKIIAVYSPVGGCGKTALALSVCGALAGAGKKCLYVNFEKISGTDFIFSNEQLECLSDVLLSLKNKNTDPGLKIELCRITDPDSGVSYFNPPISAWEYNELTAGDLHRLLEAFQSVEDLGYVVLDLSSEYTEHTVSFLKECERVLVPFTPEKYALKKVKRFFNEMQLHHNLTIGMDKFVPVVNRTVPTAREDSITQARDVLGRPVMHVIPEIGSFAKLDKLPDMARAMRGVITPQPAASTLLEGVL